MTSRLIGEWLRHRTGRLAVLLGLYTLLFISWVLFGASRLPHRAAIGDLAFLPMGLTAAALTWKLSTHPSLAARDRTAWRIVGLALFSYAAGDVLWAYFEVGRGIDPFPSAADAGYLLFYPLLMIGLLLFPFAPHRKQSRVKFWLDAGTVLLGGWMAIWYFVLGPIALSHLTDPVTTALTVAHPIGDLILIFATASMLLRQPDRGSRHALGILAAGIASFLIADVAFGYRDLEGIYEAGDWPDAFWMVAWFLFAASALYQSWRASHQAAGEHWPAEEVPSISALPYVAVAVGFSLLMVAGRYATPYPLGGLLYGAIAITAFVVIRQLTVMGENLQLVAALRELAATDALTGLLNRRGFLAMAEREFARYQRYKHPLSAIVVDVDNLKDINDRHGHKAGDEALQAISEQFRRGLRKVDLAGRYGGDELAVLLPETDWHGAVGVAQRLLGAVSEQTLAFGAHLLKVTISAGVASAEGTQSVAALLHRADQALYDAKQAGRNQIKLTAPRVET